MKMDSSVMKNRARIGFPAILVALVLIAFALFSEPLKELRQERHKPSVSELTSAESKWGVMKPIGLLRDVRPLLKDKKGVFFTRVSVHGTIIETDQYLVPLQTTTIAHELGSSVRTLRRKDLFDIVCIGSDQMHKCYMSEIEGIEKYSKTRMDTGKDNE